MKSFVKKIATWALASSLLVPAVAWAQDADNKVNFTVQGDLVSSYIWRGFYQTGASIQPTLALGVGNFALTAWGSTDFQGVNASANGAAKEIDLTAAYRLGEAGPTLQVASLWWAGQGAGNYFHFKSHETAHHFEAGLSYTLPVEAFPLSFAWYTMFAGADKKADGSQAYSSYMELNYPFTVNTVDLNATLGILPYDAGVTTYGDVNDHFAVTNVALKATRAIKISDSFSLPIFAQAIWNPCREDAHLVLGITLRP